MEYSGYKTRWSWETQKLQPCLNWKRRLMNRTRLTRLKSEFLSKKFRTGTDGCSQGYSGLLYVTNTYKETNFWKALNHWYCLLYAVAFFFNDLMSVFEFFQFIYFFLHFIWTLKRWFNISMILKVSLWSLHMIISFIKPQMLCVTKDVISTSLAWDRLDKYSICILSLIYFAWNGLLIASHIWGSAFDATLLWEVDAHKTNQR